MGNEILKIEGVSKKYRLGMIGGTSLKEELQRKRAARKGLDDPTRKVTDETSRKTGEEFLALDDINLTINQGERVGIIGHNGAGKSTLLKLISRITAPTTGTIEMNGRVASMLEVGTGFHPELSGRENVYLNGAILGMTRDEIDAKMEDVIEFSECRQFIDTPVKRYSSGMYVKLAFSVAAHLDSEIIIMDEVLAVGDAAFQRKCLDKMNEISESEGRTVLYVSHNMNTIQRLCKRVVMLDHGRMVFDGDVNRAIEMYLNNTLDNDSVSIDLPLDIHFGSQCSYELQMTHIEIINKEIPAFYDSEVLEFVIQFDSFVSLDNAKFRLTLRTAEDVAVATSWSDAINIHQGNGQKMLLEFPLYNIPRGSFFLCIGFYQNLSNGDFVMIDHVNRAIRINVEQQPDDGSLIWSSTFWGPIKLPNIICRVI